MFILETEHGTEAPTLDQLLRDWWVRLSNRLWRSRRPEKGADANSDEGDHSESLIL
jgi:hypothetical protein